MERKFVITNGCGVAREFNSLDRANAARKENHLVYGRIIAEYEAKHGLFGKVRWVHVADHIGK